MVFGIGSARSASMESAAFAAMFPASITEKLNSRSSAHEAAVSALSDFGTRVCGLLQDICMNSDFMKKYEMSTPKQGEPYLYALTTLNSPYKYLLEAFPTVSKLNKEDLTKGPQALMLHEVFESVIERYTDTRAKPNAVLHETRSTHHCYPLMVTIEAVPFEKARKPQRLLLLREFLILVSLWEQYRSEMLLKKCNNDQLVGFPMPFEFCSVAGTEFDIPKKSFENLLYYGIDGTLLDIETSFKIPLSRDTTLKSTLSYMSTEKLGPSVTYLTDLLRTQSKPFTLSSALMIFDQLLCRLIVMHRYGVVHGDLNIDCLRFGSRNACNVLYISDFSTSVQLPSKITPSFYFHDRFVSTLRVKDKKFHFVNDLESAYYIFVLLAVGCLPWDNKLKTEARGSIPLVVGPTAKDSNPVTDMSSTVKDKENFWESQSMLHRLVNSREFELDGGLYHNFTEDLIMTIHNKMKDIMTSCASISSDSFMRDIGKLGTAANNAYSGLRKTIASYFRFEMLNSFMKDPTAQSKIDLLKSHDPNDNRVAFDMSSWCWNIIVVDTKPTGLTGYLHKTVKENLFQRIAHESSVPVNSTH